MRQRPAMKRLWPIRLKNREKMINLKDVCRTVVKMREGSSKNDLMPKFDNVKFIGIKWLFGSKVGDRRNVIRHKFIKVKGLRRGCFLQSLNELKTRISRLSTSQLSINFQYLHKSLDTEKFYSLRATLDFCDLWTLFIWDFIFYTVSFVLSGRYIWKWRSCCLNMFCT